MDTQLRTKLEAGQGPEVEVLQHEVAALHAVAAMMVMELRPVSAQPLDILCISLATRVKLDLLQPYAPGCASHIAPTRNGCSSEWQAKPLFAVDP